MKQALPPWKTWRQVISPEEQKRSFCCTLASLLAWGFLILQVVEIPVVEKPAESVHRPDRYLQHVAADKLTSRKHNRSSTWRINVAQREGLAGMSPHDADFIAGVYWMSTFNKDPQLQDDALAVSY